MRLILLLILLTVLGRCYSQQKEFELEGLVVDSTLNPIEDAYIINMRTMEKSISKPSGVFQVNVLSGDSLAILHVSFNRKYVRVFELLKNPVVKLETENVNIGQVDVSARQETDYEKVMKNISSISETKYYETPKIESDPDPSMQLMIVHNRILRSEATSLRLMRFSPSKQIGKLFRNLKKKKDRKMNKQ
jgi:hypothetical protein